MTLNSLLIIRCLILVAGLAALYRLWTSTHLIKKSLFWLIFQASVAALWLSGSYPYHGHWNPLPQVAAFLLIIFSIGVLAIMLVFASGVLRNDGVLEIKKTNFKGHS